MQDETKDYSEAYRRIRQAIPAAVSRYGTALDPETEEFVIVAEVFDPVREQLCRKYSHGDGVWNAVPEDAIDDKTPTSVLGPNLSYVAMQLLREALSAERSGS